MVAVLITAELLVIAGMLVRRAGNREKAADSESSIPAVETGTEEGRQEDTDGRSMDGDVLQDTAAEEILTQAGGEMLSLYSLVLQGDFDSSGGYEYHFGKDGEYSGFYDAERPYIRDGQYEIVQDNNFDVLNIYNGDGGSVVKYYLTFNGDGNVVLSVPDTDVQIVLELMGK